MNTYRRALFGLVLALPLGALQAQTWPNKPVRMVVAFPPGGPADAVARAIGQAISPALAQQVIVDNRPGALGTIGADSVARSPADGYTALLGFSGGHSLTPAIMTMKYDPLKELPPLLGVARSAMVLVTGSKNKGMTLQDFIKLAKSKSDPVNVGGIGTGSTNHLVGELFKRAAGIKGQHVPYNGASPLALAAISGEVELAVIDVGGVLSYLNSGNLIALAVASDKRSEFLPNVPTTAEAGFPTVVSENVYGVFLPKGVPNDIQSKLGSAIATAIGSQPVQEQFHRLGLVPQVIAKAELDALIKKQAETLVPIAQELKIRMD
ncbi:tripartite tricarboxylate transporter substrate-binding protein [soil metagenome]